MFQIRCVLLLVFTLTEVSFSIKLPASFQKCKVSPALDGKQNECLMKATQDALPILGPGIKELGILPLDPLNVIEMKIEKGGDGPVKMKFTYSNCLLSGLKNGKILHVGGKLSSPDGFHLTMDALVPLVEMKGPYSIKAQVLALPIDGEGDSNLMMYNSKYHFDIFAEKQVKNNEPYLKVKKVKLSIEEPENLKVHLDNLFNGDKTLGESTNRFLNDNWRDIYGELKGPLTNAFIILYEEYAKRILERVPFNDLFIVDE